MPRQDDRPHDQRPRPRVRHHLRLDPALRAENRPRREDLAQNADPARSARRLQGPHRGEYRPRLRILRPRARHHRGAGRHGSGAHQRQTSGGDRLCKIRGIRTQHDVHADHRHPQAAGQGAFRGICLEGRRPAGLRSVLGRLYAPSRSLHAAGRRRRFETVGQFALGLALRRSERRQGLHRIAGRGVRPPAGHGRFDHPDRPARTADPLPRSAAT